MIATSTNLIRNIHVISLDEELTDTNFIDQCNYSYELVLISVVKTKFSHLSMYVHIFCIQYHIYLFPYNNIKRCISLHKTYQEDQLAPFQCQFI